MVLLNSATRQFVGFGRLGRPSLEPAWRVRRLTQSLYTHRPLSSSFFGLPYRILNIKHKKELLVVCRVSILGIAMLIWGSMPHNSTSDPLGKDGMVLGAQTPPQKNKHRESII